MMFRLSFSVLAALLVLPVQYPANAGMHEIPGRRAAVLAAMHLDGPENRPLQLKRIDFKKWSDVDTNGVVLNAIAPGRMVYEVVTTFDQPYTVHGITYAFGTHRVVFDATTGNALYGSTSGHVVTYGRKGIIHTLELPSRSLVK